MITKLPLDIQRKIQNYICELYISEKKEMYKEVYHELLCGWWYYKQPDGSYLVYSTYSDIPTRLALSLNEIRVLYNSPITKWRPILNYYEPPNKAPLFDFSIDYYFVDRLPPLICYETT